MFGSWLLCSGGFLPVAGAAPFPLTADDVYETETKMPAIFGGVCGVEGGGGRGVVAILRKYLLTKNISSQTSLSEN